MQLTSIKIWTVNTKQMLNSKFAKEWKHFEEELPQFCTCGGAKFESFQFLFQNKFSKLFYELHSKPICLKMLWLLPLCIKTVLYLFGCPVGGILSFFSSITYTVFLVFFIPTYFLYAGPEAAVRFSLLLCVHSLLLAMIPNILVSLF